MQSVSVNLDPAQYLAGWRPDAGYLFVPVLSESRVGEEVAVRVGILGQAIRATLFGKVAAVRRVGRPTLPPGVELQLDRQSAAAAGFLAMAARGDPVSFRERAPRYAAERTIVLVVGGAEHETQTQNVSEGGCSVRWRAPLPAVGDVMGLRVPGGLFPPTGRAVVCWTHQAAPGQADRSIGLRLVSHGRAGRAWRGLVAEVAKSGARIA